MIHFPKKYIHTPLALSVAAVLSGVTPIAVQADTRLEEIIVTSTKRDEMLSDVPISVSAMSGEKIVDAGIPSFEQFSAYIPNFSVSQNPIGDYVSIRGIQSGALASIEQSVGTYVDGVYRGRGVQSRFAFLDVGAIEVLRGPQGTLFGKNTIGGALNITSAAPTYEFDSSVAAMYEFEHEETEIIAHVSGPITDTVTARLAILSRQIDKGWVENNYGNPVGGAAGPSNDPVQTYSNDAPLTDEAAGRLSLNWDVNDDLVAKFKYEYGEWDNEGQPFEEVIVGPSLVGIYGLLGIPGDTTPGDFKTSMGNNTEGINYGAAQLFEGDISESAIELNYQTDAGIVTTIVGYSAYEFDRSIDADFNAIDGLGYEEYEDFEQSSLEVRYVFETEGGAEYIVGGYWQDSDLILNNKTLFNVDVTDGDSLGPIVAGAIGAAGAMAVGQLNRAGQFDQESDTIAAFAQGTWNISDTLRLTLGGRYGEETKEATQDINCAMWDTYEPDPNCNPVRQSLGEFTPHTHDLERNEYQATYNGTLAWDATDEIMTYVTIATGVKSGGFNNLAFTDDIEEAEFEEEEVISFEIGAKMMLLDGAAELNVAIFDMDYDDLQATIFTGSTGFVVKNAASASSRGIEIDGRWQMTDQLQLRGALGYVDFEYEDYTNAGCTDSQKTAVGFAGLTVKPPTGTTVGKATAVGDDGSGLATSCEQDLSGGTNPFTPELSANISVEYEVDFSGYYFRAVVDANYTDEHHVTADNDDLVYQDAYTAFNTTLTVGPETDEWDISLIGRNITDEEYYTYANDMPLMSGSHQIAWGRPANYAIRGRVRF